MNELVFTISLQFLTGLGFIPLIVINNIFAVLN